MKSLANKEYGGHGASSNEIFRLQRTNRDILQLSKKLKSYTCEPCTQSLFENAQLLKEKIEVLRRSNEEIISSISQHKHSNKNLSEVVQRQIKIFNDLRDGVYDYSEKAQTHHSL